MKKMILSAGAFLLSSSALVGVVHANSNEVFTSSAPVLANSAAWAMNPMLQGAVVDAGLAHMHATQTDWMADRAMKDGAATDKAMTALYSDFDGAMSYQEAAAWTGDKNSELSAVHMAEKQSWLAQNGGGGTAMAMSAKSMSTDMSGNADMAGKPEASADPSWTGQGGPDEAAMASDQTTWPACRPGPGDDRCIQLYERGVRGAYAQWSAGRSQLAMGGPEEPLTGKEEMASADMAMTSGMAAPAKTDMSTGPTTEPTGTPVAGKSAMNMGMAEGSADMAGVDAATADTMTHDGMTAEEMQANSAWGSQANRA